MLKDGDLLPVSSNREDIMSDPHFENAIVYLVVSVPDTKSRTVRVNVTVPEMTLKQIDTAAKKRGIQNRLS